jgi:hypothetical protein
MDFVNFAAVEFVGAIEAQRAFERKQRKWLQAWRMLERTGGTQAEIKLAVIASDPPPMKRAA